MRNEEYMDMLKPLSIGLSIMLPLSASLLLFATKVPAQDAVSDTVLATADNHINPWAQLAEADLTQIYNTAKADHPGAVDAENPYFKRWLEQGYLEGIERAQKATTLQDTINTIRYYIAGFADGHFGLRVDYQARKQLWTGIGLAKQGSHYQVSYLESQWSRELPPLGASLISCDGQDVALMMNDEILTYRFNNQALNSKKVRYAKKLLIDDGIGVRTHPTSCVFEVSDKQQRFELAWKKVSTTALANKLQLGTLPSEFELIEFKPNHYRVTLPNFYPNADEEIKLKAITQQLKALRGAELIVFDTRGNGGGNSQWGVDLLGALYSKQYVDSIIEQAPDNSYALWRVSESNVAHLGAINKSITAQFGADSVIVKAFSQTEQDMKVALVQGEPFVKQASGNDSTSNSSDTEIKPEVSLMTETSQYKGKTVLLTDSYCGSACLDFADLSLSIPGLVHVGEETSADTVYMDVRMVPLSSGLGEVSLAQKVYRERARGHNESYIPEHIYEGKMTDVDGLQQWILKVLDK